MSNNQTNIVALHLQKARLEQMLLDEEKWITAQKERIAEMHNKLRDFDGQISNVKEVVSDSTLHITSNLLSQRIQKEETHLASMEFELQILQYSILQDISKIDRVLNE